MDHGWRWPVIALLAAVVIALGAVAWWTSRSVEGDYKRLSGEAFGTRYHITYRGGPGVDKVRQAVEVELDRIDAMASTWRSDSELMRYNRADEPEAFALSEDLKALLDKARRIEAQTDRAYALRPDGKQIDLSAIAKGFAVDRVVHLLENDFGIRDGLVDIGGEVKAKGDGPAGSGWRVSLHQPKGGAGGESPKLVLHDSSVATSGTYFQGDHIVDPDSGEPVVNALLSASVVHPDNATADALATALYVLGPQRGMAWAEKHGIHAIFLLKDGTRLEHQPD